MPIQDKPLSLSDYDYDYPENLVASKPLADRDDSRLLVYRRKEKKIIDAKVRDLPEFLPPRCQLVANNAKVLPARIITQRASGGNIEILLHKHLRDHLWKCKILNSRRLKIPETINVLGNQAQLIVLQKNEDHTFDVSIKSERPLIELLEKHAYAPIPPYIRKLRDDEREHRQNDLGRYQTVFASELGAVAAPTAGLHFTKELLENLSKRGMDMLYLTLFVGLGTFEPIKCDDISKHKMHSEYFKISPETARQINAAKADDRPVIAIGTTTTRALESSAENRLCVPKAMETDIFIYPGFEFKIVDGLFTNFHLPQSSLLLLVSAFCGWDEIQKIYRHAIDKKYRFFSYGDACLFL